MPELSPVGGDEFFTSRDHHHHHLSVPDDFGPTNSTNAIKPKKKRESTLRKAPQAPKRFKSSYIIFFMAQQDVIKDEIGLKASVGEVSKKSSEKWKKLKPHEKAVWEEKARLDKERYNLEKERYTGPWQIPYKRAKKDPNAPKRPMSAFLYYSQAKRTSIKEQYKGVKNTEISRILGQMWKSCSQEERTPFIDREKAERDKYKVKIAKWRQEDAKRKVEKRELEAEQNRQAASKRQSTFENLHPYPIDRHQVSDTSHFPPPPLDESQYNYYRGSGYHNPPPQHNYYPPPPNYSDGNYQPHGGYREQVYLGQEQKYDQPHQLQRQEQTNLQPQPHADQHQHQPLPFYKNHDQQDIDEDELNPLPFLPDGGSEPEDNSAMHHTNMSDPYSNLHPHPLSNQQESQAYHHSRPDAYLSSAQMFDYDENYGEKNHTSF